MIGRVIGIAALLSGGLKDETVSGYAVRGAVYVLEEIDGGPPPARATLVFPAPGQVSGEGPCNGYRAAQTVPYPWFRLEGFAATRRACPELAFEAAFFAALAEMTLAEAHGPVLILSNDAGRALVFRAE